jgi:hypothetical protein
MRRRSSWLPPCFTFHRRVAVAVPEHLPQVGQVIPDRPHPGPLGPMPLFISVRQPSGFDCGLVSLQLRFALLLDAHPQVYHRLKGQLAQPGHDEVHVVDREFEGEFLVVHDHFAAVAVAAGSQGSGG